MGYQVEGHVVDPRETGGGPVGQSRQLPAVAARKVPAREGDLLLDEIVVVEQPGCRRSDPLLRGDRCRHHRNTPRQGLVRCRPASGAVVPAGAPVDGVAARQRPRVTFQLVDAEKLSVQQPRLRVGARRVLILDRDYWPPEGMARPLSCEDTPLDTKREARETPPGPLRTTRRRGADLPRGRQRVDVDERGA